MKDFQRADRASILRYSTHMHLCPSYILTHINSFGRIENRPPSGSPMRQFGRYFVENKEAMIRVYSLLAMAMAKGMAMAKCGLDQKSDTTFETQLLITRNFLFWPKIISLH